MSTPISQKSQSNHTVTIHTLRERATEMLRTADYLEAAQKLVRIRPGEHQGSTIVRRPMSRAARRKLSQAARARAAAVKKEPTVIKKAA